MTIIAVFDLDHTLLEGDSDVLWGEYMVKNKLVKDADAYHASNERFYQDYKQGKLDVAAYLAFSLKPLTTLNADELLVHSHAFIEDVISPLVRPKGLERVQWHKEQGHIVVIATSTNDFIATPISRLCQADKLIATRLEYIAGHYTGNIMGDPAYGQGKVNQLNAWMKEDKLSWVGSYGYSDAYMDLPLLDVVSSPYVINPDEALANHAKTHQWETLNFAL